MKKNWVLMVIFLFAAFSVQGATKILFLGDSLTSGYGVAKDEAYPLLVQASLNAQGFAVQVVNGGISGSTTASAVGRLKWYLKSKPDLLFLALGANDGLRGQSIEGIKNNLTDCILLAKKHHLPVILAGMKMPPNYGKEYTGQFETVFRQVAQQTQVPLLPFLLKGVAGRERLNQADGIHPNREGHKKVGFLVSAFVAHYLAMRQ